MTRDELNQAVRLSLLMPDRRSDLHNIYSLRAKRQEREVRAQLGYAGARTRVENVTYLRPLDDDTRPAA